MSRRSSCSGAASGGNRRFSPQPAPVPRETGPAEITVPPAHDWRTTDEDEINRRRLRAREETFGVRNLEARFPVYSTFEVASGSGLQYRVEIRDVTGRQFACTCQDFRKNGLGTCKHVEAVLLHLEARFKRRFQQAALEGSPRLDVVPDETSDTLRIERGQTRLPARVRPWFAGDGRLIGLPVEEAFPVLSGLREQRLPELRLSIEIEPWLAERQRRVEQRLLRREYEQKVHSGEWPSHETRVPLFPYQREGMLHLAFTERALLADEMGLGKTIQAIAACALLHRLGKVSRVLVVSPASLKAEWEEQIGQFTHLPCRLVYGSVVTRRALYELGTFFTLVNYEQIIRDAPDINTRFRPDVVILDEAQRIKNWDTKTAQAVKRLQSRYAFVLTGTPIENRIDELYSIMDFLEPRVLGPLFRFNRDFYELDDRGRPSGYRQLGRLHERIAPYMLRRRKLDVETELPERTDRQHFVALTQRQKDLYTDHEEVVSRLANLATRRPLTKAELERLMMHLAMMRMICDTPYILDPAERDCPKLGELEKILEECRDNEDVKVIVFSEWERMLQLVRDLCQRLQLGYAWHTGSVPQKRRRAEIQAFKADPNCRVFLSTDSGSAGLNLQSASVVINCDLPWNPAKLEQRIARAWRKHQTRPVTVVNLVAENTLEHRMLDTLAQKRALADGVLDQVGDLEKLALPSGRQAFLNRLQQLMRSRPEAEPRRTPPRAETLPADRPLAFGVEARRMLGEALVLCEERFPRAETASVIYVVVEGPAAAARPALEALHERLCPERPGQEPVRLEILDRATHEALERLIQAGLIAPVARAARPLLPVSGGPPPLPPEQLARARQQRDLARHNLKLAGLLVQGGFGAEARRPLLEALFALAVALAIEARLPEPGSVEDACRPPVAAVWNGAIEPLRAFVAGPDSPPEGALEALTKRLKPEAASS